jgi:thioredoxin reductase (NADPH)
MRSVVIVGHGPAGISAAIYLKRSNIDVLVIGKDLGALSGYHDLIENYYGLSEPVSGETLIKNGIKQAIDMGIELLFDDVIALMEIDGGFRIKTKTTFYEAKTVLLATGKVRTGLNITGFAKYRGKGISMCATCDGYFYRNKRVGIVGSGHYMMHELEYLNRISEEVIVFTNGKPLTVEVHQQVIEEPLVAFLGEQKLTHVQTAVKNYPLDGVFLAIGAPSSLEFASQLGVIVDKGSVVVDQNYQTNVSGLFAAGDIIGGKLQISKAVFDGMNVADSIVSYLKSNN